MTISAQLSPERDRAVIIAISLKRKRPTTSPWQWVDYFYCSLHVDSRLFTSHTQSPNVESLDCEITAVPLRLRTLVTVPRRSVPATCVRGRSTSAPAWCRVECYM